MSRARGKRSQPVRPSAPGSEAPGRESTAVSKGTPGRSGASGPAGPRSRRGSRATEPPPGHGRGGTRPRGTGPGSAPETTRAAQIDALGCPGQLDREVACRPGRGGRRRSRASRWRSRPPAAGCRGRPGGSPPARRAPGVATACQPALTLWPRTSSKGSVAPVASAPWVSMCEAVAVTAAAGPGWVAGRSWASAAAVVVGGPGRPRRPSRGRAGRCPTRCTWSGALAQGGLWPRAV